MCTGLASTIEKLKAAVIYFSGMFRDLSLGGTPITGLLL